MSELYLGALTGTSMNSLDAAIFDFQPPQPKLLAAHALPFPDTLRDKLQNLVLNPHGLREYALVEHALSRCMAQSIHQVLKDSGLSAAQIAAAGVHGQTLLHQTRETPKLTLQLLDPNVISHLCEMPVVSDFRRRDLANEGEGAPLAPLLHEQLFRSTTENRAVVNIGGIANVTLLPTEGKITGFDSGPGGGLLDEWSQLHLDELFDCEGQWARTGTVQPDLLDAMLKDPYFSQEPPKSTSREYFNRPWLESLIDSYPTPPQDVQTTLTELTARSIAFALQSTATPCERILLCGGGARNTYLTERIAEHASAPVEVTDTYGLDVEWVECCLFAWLARQRMHGKAVDLTAITGSRQAAVLGAIWSA